MILDPEERPHLSQRRPQIALNDTIVHDGKDLHKCNYNHPVKWMEQGHILSPSALSCGPFAEREFDRGLNLFPAFHWAQRSPERKLIYLILKLKAGGINVTETGRGRTVSETLRRLREAAPSFPRPDLITDTTNMFAEEADVTDVSFSFSRS